MSAPDGGWRGWRGWRGPAAGRIIVWAVITSFGAAATLRKTIGLFATLFLLATGSALLAAELISGTHEVSALACLSARRAQTSGGSRRDGWSQRHGRVA